MAEKSQHSDLNAKKWDLRAETFDQGLRSKYFHFAQKRTIDSLPLKEGVCFLDLGCGTGWAVRYVARLLKGRGKFYGIDVSPKMIEKANDSSRDLNNVHFYQADAEKLPFESSFFDFIICTHSFHHYSNPSRALHEIHRALKPGARVYIMDVTSDDFITRWIDRLVKRKEREHVKFYSSRDYHELFEKAQIRYVASRMLVFPLSHLKVHIGEKE